MSVQLGANQAISPLDFSAEDILDQYGAFDVMIEAAGVQSAVDLCTELVAQHGKIILVGYHQSNDGMRFDELGSGRIRTGPCWDRP